MKQIALRDDRRKMGSAPSKKPSETGVLHEILLEVVRALARRDATLDHEHRPRGEEAVRLLRENPTRYLLEEGDGDADRAWLESHNWNPPEEEILAINLARLKVYEELRNSKNTGRKGPKS